MLCDAVMEALAPRTGALLVDATAGGGGHTRLLLDAVGTAGRVLAIDRDPRAIESLRTACADDLAMGRLVCAIGNFADLTEIAHREGFQTVDGILLDLGLSSDQLERGGRGFSFERDEPLDLRFDPTDPTLDPAARHLARARVDELARVIQAYGEERYARRIARHLVEARQRDPIDTAPKLAACVRAALPPPARRFANRSVARVFQALRILTNSELQAIERALPQLPGLLAPGGRVAIISFHSLEDRLVKRFFREAVRGGKLRAITKKPLWASDQEIAKNPRARSARLRATEKPRS